MCISYVTKCDRVSESFKKMLTCDLFTYLCSGIAQSMHTNELLGMMDEVPVVGACQVFVYAPAWCWMTDGQVLSKIPCPPPPRDPRDPLDPQGRPCHSQDSPKESLVTPRTPRESLWAPRDPLEHQGRPWATPKGNQGILRTVKGLLVAPLRILWDFPETQFFGGWVLTAGL